MRLSDARLDRCSDPTMINVRWNFKFIIIATGRSIINMARGKFNKRGGGSRLDAQSAEEIELRNERLAAFEEERTRRRAEEAEEGEEGEDGEKKEGGDDETVDTSNAKKKKAEEEKEPVKVTSAEEHRRNLAKLEAVRKRREVAEMRRKQDEEAAEMADAERKMKAASMQKDDSDDEGDKKKKKSKEKTIPKLTSIEIKKMKPALLKEALKERGLEIQGNAKELLARLLAYEEAR